MRHPFALVARAVLALALVLPVTAAADAVDDYVRSVMAEQKIPGVSLVVLQNGKVVKSAGYGFANLEHEVPATPQTIYQSGSMGKQFTAAGILLLAEDGKLELDDPLAKYFPDGPASWHRITIRHLLTHTSGLKDYGGDEIDFRKDYTEAEYLEIMQRLPLEFEPGTQWSYSNSGYLILGILTSRLAGKHWSEFQAERLFRPLGMKTARIISERDIVMHRAAGYELDEHGEIRNQEWVAPSANRCADGALYFSVEDLAAWDAALTAHRFLKPEHFEAWWTPVKLASGTTYPYGFGWSLDEQRGYPLIEHGGSWQGFRTAIARYVEQGLTIAVLANLAQAQPETMAHEIAGILEPSLLRPDPGRTARDPDGGRAERLLDVLAAWADYRSVPAMTRGLAETASHSAREAYSRAQAGRRLAALTGFRYLGEDDLTERPIDRRGERVATIAYYALDTEDKRHAYSFQLTADGRVVDFASEER
jgi:CubicO group peptidase (beta-lactamase class C family)